MSNAPELQDLEDQFGAIDRDVHALVSGLTEELGGWRANPHSWSVAQCLDHIATANRVYLAAMQPAALHAQEQGRQRRGPALPGIVSRLFLSSLEPPVKLLFRMKSPRSIRPRAAVPLGEALATFFASQNDVLTFLRVHANLDLAGVRFPNPLVRGIRFSLATRLLVIAAHERRHLWQAWRVRRAAERAVPAQVL